MKAESLEILRIAKRSAYRVNRSKKHKCPHQQAVADRLAEERLLEKHDGKRFSLYHITDKGIETLRRHA